MLEVAKEELSGPIGKIVVNGLIPPEDPSLAMTGKVPAGYRLLIIDDNDDIRIFLQDAFANYMEVDVAEDGENGLNKAIENNPDLIICDVMMPVMDGFEVTRKLKSEFHTCHIPIVLLTAHSSPEHQLEGIESGADAYITKPFSLKYLVKRVMKLIEQREQLKRRFSKDFVIDGSLVAITDRDQDFMERIEKILEDNYKDVHFTIDRFVELADMKRTLFFKKVKGITGFSPNELIKLKRLNESAVLLRQGNWTVSEVSYKVGFDDPYYFSKCFKAHFNCTPSRFKQGDY
jgi:CheY-like chemotaxis protein